MTRQEAFAQLSPATRALMRRSRRRAWNEGRVVLFRRSDNGRLDLYTLNTVARAHTFAGEVGGIVPRSKVRPS